MNSFFPIILSFLYWLQIGNVTLVFANFIIENNCTYIWVYTWLGGYGK